MAEISQARVLMMATNGFEEAELFETRQGLLNVGAEVILASMDKNPIQGVVYDGTTQTERQSNKSITPDLTLDEVDIQKFDALVLPGGVVNPDALRIVPKAIDIVRGFVGEGKPVAAICHAPWLLVEANVVDGRRMTGWFSVRTDLANAGADVVDERVVVDGNLITSRMPADVPAFTRALVAALAQTKAKTLDGGTGRAQTRPDGEERSHAK